MQVDALKLLPFAVVGIVAVVGLSTIFAPQIEVWRHGDHDQTVRDLVWMPDGAELTEVEPRYGMRGRLLSLHGSVVYSREAWDDLEANLHETGRFSPTGASFRGFDVTASAGAKALAWHDEGWATIGMTGEEVVLEPNRIEGIVALRWLHVRPQVEKPWKSMCYAVIGGGWQHGAQTIEPCTAHLHHPRGLSFAVQVFLDREARAARIAVR